MKTAGIIAEYNPFHNGHQYQIETVRHLTGADFVIVAMSGDFLQRGVPAIADKYTRTRMALLGGADLVLELPAVWATASAEYFAAAHQSTITGMNTITREQVDAKYNEYWGDGVAEEDSSSTDSSDTENIETDDDPDDIETEER